MDTKERIERWHTYPQLEDDVRRALDALLADEQALEDCFYQDLAFGTGGMRGEIGPGPNRMNTYTVRRAAEGLARFIEKRGKEAKARGVAIAFDSRHKSAQFAREAARTLGAHGIKTYVFTELHTTPQLSFSVRHLQAQAGIVITASHNPPEYNGFKVYGEDGGQFPPALADELVACVGEIEDELAIAVEDIETLHKKGLYESIGEVVDDAYHTALQTILLQPEMDQQFGQDISIVFTPLHGTATAPVTRAFAESGFKNVTVVSEQALPDPEFSTVTSPNPEESAAFEMAIDYGKRHGADILIATDPDADRVGLAVKNETGDYVLLTGNQTGALMIDYLLQQQQEQGILPENGVILKTIVTSEIGRAIATAYGLAAVDTLTGFKFIGEKMGEYERSDEHTYLFGYEESYGYLIGDFVRDKDAVQACLFAAEMALHYKREGKTLFEALQSVFARYGYYKEDLQSLTLKGKEGAEKIAHILTSLRANPPKEIDGLEIVRVEDYESRIATMLATEEKAPLSLPQSNVLKYILADESWFCVRPSGTEPKVKFYFGVVANSEENSFAKLKQLKRAVLAYMQAYIDKK
ncbi:phospho-sugar mutase [Bacillus sp. FSL W7-1360]